jgi:uncharacterized protein (TIGR03435 family)
MRRRALLSVFALSLTTAFAQERPVFEAASIKPVSPGSLFTRPRFSVGGRFNVGAATLRTLIGYAYTLIPFQLSGGPRWLDSDKFEVIAKGADPSGEAQVRLMLQSLLTERFQLTMHHETKEQAISVLTVKGTPKLQPAKEGERYRMDTSISGRDATSGHVAFKNTSMQRLCEILSGEMDRLVVNQTGLTGEYDFEFDSSRAEGDPNPFNTVLAPSISDVGLKLESKRGPVDFFMIDRAEKPSAN